MPQPRPVRNRNRPALLLLGLLLLLPGGHSYSHSHRSRPVLGGKRIFSLLRDRPMSLSLSVKGKKAPAVVAAPRLQGGSTAAPSSGQLSVPPAVTSTTASTTSSKALWYTKVFPIFPHELLKFFSLSSMMFWIIFVFTMSRDTKDTLIVTNCGAEAIAFLKVYGVIPAATAFMVLYTRLANRVDSKTLFYLTLAPFFAFYSIFAFVLYPLRHQLHPMHWQVPSGGLAFPVNLLRHWTFSLYYIVSDLWGSAGIPLLFWSCANDLVSLEQSSRWYPLMALFGNLGPIFSGLVMTMVGRAVAGGAQSLLGVAPEDAFEQSLKILAACMLGAGGIISWLHHFVHSLEGSNGIEVSPLLSQKKDANYDTTNSVMSKINNNNEESGNNSVERSSGDVVQKIRKKEKPKLSFFESVQVLLRDKYLMKVAMMVVSYGLTMEFTEIIWKSTVKKAYPLKTDYLAFMGRYSSLVGAASFLMMFVGAQVNQVLGWRVAALTTPVMMGLLAVPFFASIMLGGVDSKRSLLVAVYVGLLQNVLSKATKYAIFDPTKEMTYIPLSKEAKTQGKAAIDVLGARLGKSAGALAQQVLVVLCGSILAGAPVVAAFFYLVVALWIGSVNSLFPMFMTKSTEFSSRTNHTKS